LKISFFCYDQEDFFGYQVVESSVEVVEIEGSSAVFPSEDFGDGDVLDFVIEIGPFVIESDHIFDAFFTLLLERCGEGGLGGQVQRRCRFRTDCLQFLLWE